MMTTMGRLIRLEDRQPKGCATCRAWGPATITVIREDAGGHRSETALERPDSCPLCGRTVPIRLRRTIVLQRFGGAGPETAT